MVSAALLSIAATVVIAPSVSVTDLVEVTEISSLAISPDGQTVAFRTERPSIGDNRIHLEWYVAPINGRVPARAIADGGGPEINSGIVMSQTPIWAPSSSAFYFRAEFAGQVQIWRESIDGQAAERVTNEASNIRSLEMAPGGGSMRYQIGATRDEVAQAENEIEDNGVLVDGSVDVVAALSRNSVVDGRPATLRFSKTWFNRQPLLWDSSVHTKQLTFDPSNLPAARAVSRPAALIGRIVSNGETQELHATDRGGKDYACHGPSCPTQHIRSVVGLLDGRRVLVTTSDLQRAHTLWLWTPTSGRVRKLIQGGGTLNGGGLIGDDPCALAQKQIVCVAAEPSGPPRLVRINLATGRATALFDPNQSLRDRAWPSQPLFWTTSKGVPVGGQLLLPSSAKPAGGYPLVIDYYTCDGFLKGGLGDELPLAPLAQTGIATLCINQARDDGKTERAWEDTAVDAVKSIIDRLVGNKLVDRHRIGMAGLSFGTQVTTAVLERTSALRAAAISSAQIEPYYYWANRLPGRDITDNLRDFFGLGDPDKDQAGWHKSSAVGQITNIKAPLLMQLPESEMRLSMEFYSRLAASTTPVEMYAYPNETHVKWEPKHKLAVYQRNLDWFRFWLQGDVDANPTKREQYRRWRSYSRRLTVVSPRKN